MYTLLISQVHVQRIAVILFSFAALALSMETLAQETPEPFITGFAWSHSGQLIAVSFDNGTIEIRDTKTNQTIHQMVGHPGYVMSLSWYANDSLLASASLDRTVRIWDVVTGQNIQTIEFVLPIYSVAVGPDSTTVLVGYGDEFAKTSEYQIDNGQHIRDIVNGINVNMKYSSDRTFLALAQIANITLLDAKTLNEVGELYSTGPLREGDNLMQIAWHPSNDYLAGGTLNGEIYVWNIHNEEVAAVLEADDTLSTPESIVKGLAFDATGDNLLSFSGTGYIRTWDWQSEHMVNQEVITEPTWGVDWNSDGSILAYAPQNATDPEFVNTRTTPTTCSTADAASHQTGE